jgi:aminoglycoside/choline kinase family phosphotransferase/choline kinase
MNENWQAMILAAGFGKRLFPLTRWTPKPLVPLTSKPALYHLMEKIQATGISNLAINAHHLSGQIEDFVRAHSTSMEVEVFIETEILNTGGGLKNAEPFLNRKPCFLVHNSDILSDLSLERLMEQHERSGAVATLALRSQGNRNIVYDMAGNLLDIRGILGVSEGDGRKRGAYMGVAAFSSSFLGELPDGPSDLIDVLVELIKNEPGSVRAECFPDAFWSDIGTFQAFFDVQRKLIDEQFPDLEPKAPALVEQGSSRRYYRLGEGENSLVLMLCEKDDTDFMRFIQTSAFLNDLQLGNPQMWAWSQEHFSALLEDLGDDTLYRVYHGKSNEQQKHYVYMKTVQFLVNFQHGARENMHRCSVSYDRVLDYEHLRWESRYFCKEFLIGHRNLPGNTLDKLEREFHHLAVEVASHPQTIIHRDFQSQNLLVKEDEIHMVDYQGMRLGSVAYDFMSLINDPYVELSGEMKESLKMEFLRLIERHDEFKAGREVWERRFLSAGLQRNMQALGAYAFLSGKRNKSLFLKYMDPGVRILLAGLKTWNNRVDSSLACPELERIMRSLVV